MCDNAIANAEVEKNVAITAGATVVAAGMSAGITALAAATAVAIPGAGLFFAAATFIAMQGIPASMTQKKEMNTCKT